jgi:hypothetical protein
MALLPSLVRFCANRIALLTKIKGETIAGPREDRLTYVNVSRVSNSRNASAYLPSAGTVDCRPSGPNPAWRS